MSGGGGEGACWTTVLGIVSYVFGCLARKTAAQAESLNKNVSTRWRAMRVKSIVSSFLKASDPKVVALLSSKYFPATTYRTCRPFHGIIIYKRKPPMPMQCPLYACYALGVSHEML